MVFKCYSNPGTTISGSRLVTTTKLFKRDMFFCSYASYFNKYFPLLRDASVALGLHQEPLFVTIAVATSHQTIELCCAIVVILCIIVFNFSVLLMFKKYNHCSVTSFSL